VNSRDTTERQRVEDSLRKSQQLYQLLMDQVPVGILFTDAVGQVTNANPAVIAMFDWPSAEHARQFNVLTLEVLQRVAVSRAYRSVLANRRIEHADISYLSAARRRSDLRLVIAPLFDQPGSLLGTVTIAEDVTDRTRANREKAALLEIARDISSSLDLDELLKKATELIRSRFDFYHAAVFLKDTPGEFFVIREATGDAGAQLKRAGHKLAVGSKSVVGFVSSNGEPLIVNDTTRDATYLANPLLPNTHSEAAIPLKVGERIVGVLDVQSEQSYSFTEGNLRTLQILADQLAIKITVRTAGTGLHNSSLITHEFRINYII